MKKSSLWLLSGVALAAFVTASPALANTYASTTTSNTTRASIPVVVPSDWSGNYIGGHFGGIWSDFEHDSGTVGPLGKSGSLMGGMQIGHNWQFENIVLGAEGDFTWLNLDTHSPGVHYSQTWMSTWRARLGYALDNVLPYATAGLALTNTRFEANNGVDEENITPGFAVGGGLEAALAPNWSTRVEYLHVDVPKEESNVGGTYMTGGSDNDAVRVGFNYRFY
jgi:outer membrane immunogenic protein